MPFLRFSRDERGYESTYLCHTYRRGGRQELRVLYWFRTPPGVRVGRLALDPDAIRAIEEAHPDIRFDWDKILKVKPPPPPPEYDREGREDRRARRRRRAAKEAEADEAEAADAAAESEEPAAPGSVAAPGELADPGAGSTPADAADGAGGHVALGFTDEEGLARLRARYASIVARIAERPRDTEQLAALQAQAALLDPDAWRTREEAQARLRDLDETTEALRAALGRRRRRGGGRRRRRRVDGGEAGGRGSGDGSDSG